MNPMTSLPTTAPREVAQPSAVPGGSSSTACARSALVLGQKVYDAPVLPADSANRQALGRGESYDRRRAACDRGTLMKHLTDRLDTDDRPAGQTTAPNVATQTPLRRIGLAALAADESVTASLAMAAEAGMPLTLSELGEPVDLAPDLDRLVRQILHRGIADAIAGAGTDGRVMVCMAWHRAGLELRIHTFAGHAAASPTRDPVIGHAVLANRVAAQRGRYVATPTAAGYLVRAVLPVAEPTAAVLSHSEAA